LPEIKQTIHALRSHFIYDGTISWHIADDSSPTGYLTAIHNEFPDIHFTYTSGGGNGWGVNVNTALVSLQSKPYIFLIEDDYVARRNLNINAGVALMQFNPEVCAVRYDGIAGHTLDLCLREQKTNIGTIAFMYIEKCSPHLNVYSNRPHLRHTARFDCFGQYPEHKMLGVTESEFAYRVKKKEGCADLAILANGVEMAFNHIGKSRQGSERDRGMVK